MPIISIEKYSYIRISYLQERGFFVSKMKNLKDKHQNLEKNYTNMLINKVLKETDNKWLTLFDHEWFSDCPHCEDITQFDNRRMM